MPSPALDIAVGMSYTLVGSTVTDVMPITDVTLPGAEIEVFDSTSQASTTAKAFIPADLYDCGTFECTVQLKQDADFYDEVGTIGAVVVTLPFGGSSLAFNGILQSVQPQATTLNEPLFADVVIKVDGDVTPTAG